MKRQGLTTSKKNRDDVVNESATSAPHETPTPVGGASRTSDDDELSWTAPSELNARRSAEAMHLFGEAEHLGVDLP
jgi:hypothetical protein